MKSSLSICIPDFLKCYFLTAAGKNERSEVGPFPEF